MGRILLGSETELSNRNGKRVSLQECKLKDQQQAALKHELKQPNLRAREL
jgi:hypothetical protein